MKLFWRLLVGPWGYKFQTILLLIPTIAIYALFGEVARYFFLVGCVLNIIFCMQINKFLKKLERKYNKRYY